MNLSASPSPPQRPFFKPGSLPKVPKGGIGKWYLPAMAVIAMGFGVSNYLTSPIRQGLPFDPAEEERLRRNKELMDAYGDKENVHDIERALNLYELH